MGWPTNICCIGVLLLVSLVIISRGSNEIRIPQGMIKGKELKSRAGKDFLGFMGLPYAQNPERFESAKFPPPTWEGVYDATNYGTKCLQLNFTTQRVEGSESCLYINIFTPNVNGNFSVLAFIHGGGFQFGLAYENGPEFILDHEVVFVTFSYRLASLGFLSTEDNILPGNLGLKDQNMALRWIYENINYFGGDKNRVTLFGESAGSASVSLHLLSPLSSGLFRHAICQSGSSLDRWPIVESPKQTAMKLAKMLNCPNTNSSEAIVRCLKEKPAEEIVSIEMRSSVLESMIQYGPVIEPNGDVNSFLTESPRVLYEEGRFSRVPLIITVNDLEGLLINALQVIGTPEIVESFNNDWDNAAATAFFVEGSNETKLWATGRIRDYYFGSKLVGSDTLLNLTDAYTDSMFMHRARKTAITHSKHAPVYIAVLAFKGIWSQAFGMGFKEILGMTHADDLHYLFTDYRYPTLPNGSPSEEFSKLLVKLWVDFANTGIPDFDLNGEKWQPVSMREAINKSLNWLYLKNEPEFLEEPLRNRMILWDQIDEALETGVIPTNLKTEL